MPTFKSESIDTRSRGPRCLTAAVAFLALTEVICVHRTATQRARENIKKNPDSGLPHEDQREYISAEAYELESMGMQDKAVCVRMREYFRERGHDFEAAARQNAAISLGAVGPGGGRL